MGCWRAKEGGSGELAVCIVEESRREQRVWLWLLGQRRRAAGHWSQDSSQLACICQLSVAYMHYLWPDTDEQENTALSAWSTLPYNRELPATKMPFS